MTAENETKQQDELSAVRIYSDYVKLCHGMMVGMMVAIMLMGFGYVKQGGEQQRMIEKMMEVVKQRDELILQNIQLKEITKPTQQKINKGGVYIHKTYGVPRELAMEYSRNIMLGSIRTGLPFSVGLAVPAQESGFRADAVSYTGCCYGQWQIHFNVWRKEIPDLTLEELYDPVANTRIGYDILKQYYDQTGSLTGALERYYGSTVPEDNIAYSEQVIRRSQEISRYLQS